MPDRYRRNVAIGLLLLFSGQQTSNLVFLHVHRLADGTIIVHTHYYNKFCANNPVQPNNHTLRELTWLAAVAQTPFTGTVPPILLCLLLLSLVFSATSRPRLLFVETDRPKPSGRGPPIGVGD